MHRVDRDVSLMDQINSSPAREGKNMASLNYFIHPQSHDAKIHNSGFKQ